MNTAHKHTAGPFGILIHESGHILIDATASNERGAIICVAEIAADREDIADSQEEREANARLISAAPELLSALLAFMHAHQELDTCAGSFESYAGCHVPLKTREYFREAKINFTKANTAALCAIAKATGAQP